MSIADSNKAFSYSHAHRTLWQSLWTGSAYQQTTVCLAKMLVKQSFRGIRYRDEFEKMAP